MFRNVGPISKLLIMYLVFWLGALLAHTLHGYKLSTLTYEVVLLSLAGVCFGHILSSRYPKKQSMSAKKLQIDRLLILIICINLFLALWTLFVYWNVGVQTRDTVFENESLYGSQWVTLFVSLIIEPASYTAIILNTVSRDNSKTVFRNNALILLFMSARTLGRFPLYFLIFLMIYSAITEERTVKKFNWKKALNISFITVSILLITASLVINKIESQLGMNIPIPETLRLYVVNYHFVGFNILDLRLPEVGKESYYFPSLSAGYLDWFAHLLAKAFNLEGLLPNTFMLFMEKYTSGIYIEQLGHSYNAFSTHLLLIYAESGRLGVLFISAFLGYLGNSQPKYANQIVSPYTVLIYLTLAFSLFMPFLQMMLPTTCIVMASIITLLKKEENV